MKRLGLLIFLTTLPMYAAEAIRFPFNDKKIPSGVEDMKSIQRALQSSLTKARNATVCLEIGPGSGSGVIISADGLILSAAHVTSGVGKEGVAIFEDGRRVKCISLGLCADTDAAMVKITEEGEYPFVDVDEDSLIKLGDWVYSLGHSGGFDKERGIGVRLGRFVGIKNNAIQSDCTLIGGDSGGPLFDMHGRLVGIHSRVGATLSENLHVPMSAFVSHWESMKKSEFIGEGPFAQKPEKGTGFLGCGTEDQEGKLVVTKVGRETPAESSGIAIGDILLKLDGDELKDKKHFQSLLAEKCADDKITLILLRDAKEMTLTLKLAER
jgi:serine protease Do